MAARRYAVTFTPGLEEPVARLLVKGGAQQVRAGGAMATFLHAGKVEAPYAAHLFAVAEEGRARDGKEWLKQLTGRRGWLDRLPGLVANKATFRVVVSEEGRLVKADAKLLEKMEDLIAEATGMVSDRARPGVELWAMVRQDGMAYFLARLSRLAPENKEAPKGALKPDFCALLAALSGAGREQTALDPFAGHGGIARALSARGARVLCGDRNPALASELERWARREKNAKAYCWDALKLPLDDNCVQAVVTDPPWGDFAQLELPPDEYMARVIAEASRVLAPKGSLVLVTSLTKPTSVALRAGGFTWDEYPVLVNGKKATVFDARK